MTEERKKPLVDAVILRRLILGAVVLVLVGLGIGLLRGFNRRDRLRRENQAQEQEIARRQRVQGAPSLDDFILPGQLETERREPFFYREQRDRWSEEEIRRYWIEPDILDEQSLDDANHDLIRSLFEDVP